MTDTRTRVAAESSRVGKLNAARKLSRLIFLSGASLAVIAPNAAAQVTTWTGATDSDWFTAGNWDNGVPTGADQALIDSPANSPVISTAGAAADEMRLGDTATGSLEITGVGTLATNAALIGDDAGSSGTVTVNSATASWTNSTNLFVGYFGTGALEISAGAVSTDNLYFGFQTGGEGEGLVSGASASLSADAIVAGVSGLGSLFVEAGATVSATSLAYIGNQSFGQLAVSDAGSTFTTDTMIIGLNAAGTATVTAGGSIETQTLYMGYTANSDSELTIDGVGSVFETDFFSTGDLGAGSARLNITGGGVFIANSGPTIGFTAGSTSEIRVSGAGSRFSAPNAAMAIGNNGDGLLVLSDGGVLETDLLLLASNSGSSGTLVIGADTGAAVAPGVLDADSLLFFSGESRLRFNHTDDAYVFDVQMSGPAVDAAIIFEAGTTILTADNSFFTAPSTVLDGATFILNGPYGGAVTINDGGTFGGEGQLLGALSVSGALAPGNSIGILNATDVTFAPGSSFEVEVNAAGQSDLLNASGAVDIQGGTVVVSAAPGDYGASTNYTIIQAGSVSGTFDSAVLGSGSAFLVPLLSYDSDEVFLELIRNETLFQDVALTRNQRNTGAAAESLGAGAAVFDALLVLDAAAARNGLDSLAGDLHPSLKGFALTRGSMLAAQIQSRLMLVSEAPALAQFASLDGGASQGLRARGVWAQALGGWGETDSDGNAAGFDEDHSGMAFGADAPLGGAARLGVALGYEHANIKQAARAAEAETDAIDLSVYAGAQLGRFAVSGSLGYGWRDVESRRAVTVGAFTDSLRADYDATALNAHAELGLPLGEDGAGWGPFIGLSYIQLDTDSFTEQGGAAALTVSGDTDEALMATIGVRGATALMGAGRAFAMAAWRHAEGDVTAESRMAFAANPGAQFTIYGAPIAEDALALQLGAAFNVSRRLMFTARYDGDIAEDTQSHSVSGRMSWLF